MLSKIVIIMTLLWAGMIIGISFLESWVKFTTPSLTRPVALDVGRTVFAAFQKAQYGVMIILIILGLIAPLSLWTWLMLIGIACILVLQGIWLLPNLSKRAEMIIQGLQPPKSLIHTVYGILEILKLGLLLCFAFVLMGQ